VEKFRQQRSSFKIGHLRYRSKGKLKGSKETQERKEQAQNHAEQESNKVLISPTLVKISAGLF
jgi:hypothetical protein